MKRLLIVTVSLVFLVLAILDALKRPVTLSMLMGGAR